MVAMGYASDKHKRVGRGRGKEGYIYSAFFILDLVAFISLIPVPWQLDGRLMHAKMSCYAWPVCVMSMC